MSTVSTRKPATRKPQTLAQQLANAMARARTAKIVLVCIGFDDHGFRAEVTSEQDRSTTYTITRDPETHDLVCTCPATIVCKHIGAVLNEGANYHSTAIPASALPPTPPTPERTDSAQEEAIADFPLLMDVEAEVAIVEAEMDLAGFCWSDEARTWVRKPTIAQRAAAALPADRTPQTFSMFAEVAR